MPTSASTARTSAPTPASWPCSAPNAPTAAHSPRTPTPTPLTPATVDAERVQAACESLAATGADITFAAVAQASGISRATCYRRRELRAIIDTHRDRHGETLTLTLTGLADRVDNLTQALDAIAAKVRRQEEEIRALKRRETPTTRPTRTQTCD